MPTTVENKLLRAELGLHWRLHRWLHFGLALQSVRSI